MLPVSHFCFAVNPYRVAMGPRIVYGIDFSRIARVDSIAANLAVRGEQPAFRREGPEYNFKISDLLIMREFWIHRVEDCLNGSRFHCSRHQRAKITATIPDHHDLLRGG